MAEEITKTNTADVVPIEQVQNRIHTIRGQNVMLDSDLATLYGVQTSALNQAVSRNITRFPEDFMFSLTPEETNALISQTVISKPGKGGRRKPIQVFTEQGVAMLSSVLRSERAVQVNVAIMRAFVAMRAALHSNDALAYKILEMEQKYDKRFEVVFEAIRQLIAAPPAPERRMGFRPGPQEKTP